MDSASKTAKTKTVTKEPETKTEVKTTTQTKEVMEEVTTTKQVATEGTRTKTTEIVSEEPIIETVTDTITEEVVTEKQMRVQTKVQAAYDEETGEATYETVEDVITVPDTKTIEKEITKEKVVGTNYTVRETVTTNDGKGGSSTSVKEYTTKSAPAVGTSVESFTTYTEQEIKEYVAKKVDVEVSEVVTVTVPGETYTEIEQDEETAGASETTEKAQTASSAKSGVLTNAAKASSSSSSKSTSKTTKASTNNVSENIEVNEELALGDFSDNAENNETPEAEDEVLVSGSNEEEDDDITLSASVATPMILGSHRSSYALSEEGYVYAWGYNGYGQLGQGNTTDYNSPVKVKNSDGTGYLENIKMIAVGHIHALALDTDGNVWSWGHNNQGQMGNGTTGSVNTLPQKVVGGAQGGSYLSDIKAIYASVNNSFAIGNDGFLYSWGENYEGCLGNGNSSNQSSPNKVVTNSTADAFITGIKQVAPSYRHAIAVDNSGNVWAWGRNGNGGLGDETWNGRYYAQKVHGGEQGGTYLENIVQVAAAGSDGEVSYALTSGGDLYSWGWNGYYLTRPGDGSSVNNPVLLNTGVKKVTAGGEGNSVSVLVLKNTGEVWCRGNNGYGRLGNDTSSDSGDNWVQVLYSDPNYSNGNADYQNTRTHKLTDVIDINAAVWGYHAMAMRSDGTVWTWGLDDNGQLGHTYPQTTRYTARPIGNNGAVLRVHTGTNSATGVMGGNDKVISTVNLRAGATFTVGNVKAYLPGGLYNERNISGITYSTFDSSIATVSSGGVITANNSNKFASTMIILKATMSWSGVSHDFKGMLRINVYPSDAMATPKVVAGGYHTVVLKSDGSVWAWGRNDGYGQLGQGRSGTDQDYRYPMQVATAVTSEGVISSYLTNIVDIAAGYDFTIALDKDGNVWSWGRNDSRELGRDTSSDGNLRYVAKMLDNQPAKFVQINAGTNHSIAIDENGYVWTWGQGSYEKLGYNDNSDTFNPVRVMAGQSGFGQLRDVAYVEASYVTSYAIKSDGTLFVWGRNFHGMFGNGSPDGYYSDSYSPVQTLTGQQNDPSGYLQNVVYVGAYSTDYSNGYTIGTTFAVTADADKTLYGWGYSDVSTLGEAYKSSRNGKTNSDGSWQTSNDDMMINTSVNYDGRKVRPVKLTTGAVQVEVGGSHYTNDFVVVLKTNGKVYTMGSDDSGRLGNGWIQERNSNGDLQYNSDGSPRMINSNSSAWEEVQGISDIVSIAAGNHGWHAGAMKQDGTVWMWGSNDQGQLGIGSTYGESRNYGRETYWSSPKMSGSQGSNTLVVRGATLGGQEIGGADKAVTNVTIKTGQTLNIDVNKVYRRVGFTALGKAGEKNEVPVNTSVSLTSMDPSMAAVSGMVIAPAGGNVFGRTVVLLEATRDDYGITNTYKGMIVVNTTNDIASPKVVGGEEFTLALKSDGTVWAWGRGSEGQLGNGMTRNDIYSIVQVQRLDGVSSTYTYTGTPSDTPPSGNLENIIDIAVTRQTSFALDNSGRVWSWGSNSDNQLGRTYTHDQSRYWAMLVEGFPANEKMVAIAAGDYTGYAISDNGYLYSWGWDGNNMLGHTYNNSYNETHQRVPMRVRGGESGSQYLENVAAISASRGNAYVLKTGGTAWMWGSNGNRQNGNSNGSHYERPTQVMTGDQNSATGYLEDVIELTGSSYDGQGISYAITKDRKLYGWGYNDTYALGAANHQVTVSTPAFLRNDVYKVAAGGTGNGSRFVYIVENSTRKVYSLGYEDGGRGELGNGLVQRIDTNSDGSTTPATNGDGTPLMINKTESTWQQVTGLTNITDVTASQMGWFGAAIKQDGTIWMWGYNNYGQIGIGFASGESVNYGATSHWPSPKQVGSLGANGLVVRGATVSGGGVSSETLGGSDAIVSNVILKDDTSGSAFQTLEIDTSKVYRKLGFSVLADREVTLGTSISLTSMDPAIVTVSGNKIIPAHQGKYGSTIVTITASRNEFGIAHSYKGMIRVSTTPKDGMATPKIKLGDEQTLVLKKDGTVWAWGENGSGQIGQGTTSHVFSPAQVLKLSGDPLDNIIDITAAQNANFAVDKNGDVWSWGSNGNSILGRNYTGNENTYAAKVEGLGEKIVRIGAGTDNVYAIGESGRVWGWGHGGYNMRGDNINSTNNVPTLVLGGESGWTYLEDVVEIQASYTAVYAIRANGTAWMWGLNAYGQLGNGNTSGYNRPVQVKTGEQGSASGYLENVIEMAGQATNNIGVSFAVTEDKKLYGWGYTSTGVFGDGKDNQYYRTPIQLRTNTRKIDASGQNNGNNYAYIIGTDDKAYAIGYDNEGETGNGTKVHDLTDGSGNPYQSEDEKINKTAWTEVTGMSNTLQIATSKWGWFGGAIKTDGTVWMWGYNNYGQLGTGSQTGEYVVGTSSSVRSYWTKPVQAGGGSGSNVLSVRGASIVNSGGGSTAIGGDNKYVTNITLQDYYQPALPFEYLKIDADGIYRKMSFSTLVESQSTVSSVTLTSMDPDIVTVDSGNRTITPVHKGKYGSTVVLIKSTATDLGVSTTYKGMIRVKTAPSDGIASPMVAAGSNFTIALKKDGTVWAWGYNVNGELGIGKQNPNSDNRRGEYYPQQVLAGEQNSSDGYLHNIVHIAAGSNFSAALTNTGEIYLWGWNDNYQMGMDAEGNARPNSTAFTEPVLMNTTEIHDITTMDAGYYGMIVVRNDNTVWSWGYNGFNMLGHPTDNDKDGQQQWYPQKVQGGEAGGAYLSDVVQVSMTYFHTMALKANGSVYAWGGEQYGQLGNNVSGWERSYPSMDKPAQVLAGEQSAVTGNSFLEDIIQIDTAGGYSANGSGYHYGVSLALTEQHTVYGWGSNDYRDLGRTDAHMFSVPILIKKYTTVGESRTEASLNDVAQISVGGSYGSTQSYSYYGGSYTYSVFLDTSGKVHAIGYNGHGELGNNNTNTTGDYQDVLLLTDVVQIASSSNGYFNAAVKKDGTIWVWGDNPYGQIGDGTGGEIRDNGSNASPRKYPVQVGTESSNTLIIRKGQFASKIDDNGPMGATGNKGGSSTAFSNITLRGDDDNITSNPDLKYDAFKINREEIARKYNFNVTTEEELPLNSPKLNYTVTFESLDPTIAKVNAIGQIEPANKGKYGSTVILVKAEVKELGITHNLRGMIRVNIAHHDGVAMPQVGAGANHTIALRYDGTVWAWGRNNNGQLGNGDEANKTDIYSPVQVIISPATDTEAAVPLTDIIQIGAGSNHNIALRKDGTVWTWGYNSDGQLGIGYNTNPNDDGVMQSLKHEWHAVQVKSTDGNGYLTNIVAVSAGYDHNMAISSDGTVWAWGYDGLGQLGVIHYVDQANQILPKKVIGGAAGSKYLENITQMVGGYYHSVGLKANGSVYAWGEEQYGQIGNAISGGDRYYPWLGAPSIVHKGEQLLTLDQKDRISYYYTENSTNKALGYDYIEHVTEIDAMGGYNRNGSAYYYGASLALTEETNVFGWGSNYYGDIAYENYLYTEPKEVKKYFKSGEETLSEDLKDIVHISGGGTSGTAQSYNHYGGSNTYSLFVDKTNDVYGMGYNANGQLGNNTYETNGWLKTTQNSEDLIHEITQVDGAADGNHSVAVKKDGSVWTWGYNYYGQLGNGTTLGDNVNTNNKNMPLQVGGGGSNAMHLYYGHVEHNGVTTQTFNTVGENISNVYMAEDDVLYIDPTKISTQQSFSLLPDSKTLTPSQLTFKSFNTKLATVTSSGVVTPVAGSYGTAIILVSDPDGIYKALVRVNIKPSVDENPKSVAMPMVSAGANHTIALKYDGTVWSWGYNGNGELGIGFNNDNKDGFVNVYSPVQVMTKQGYTDEDTGEEVEPEYLKNIIQISAGSNHNIALDKDGYVWSWGYNSDGQLGDNTTTRRPVAAKVALTVDEDTNEPTSYLHDVIQIAAGYYHNVVLKKDGTVWAWGHNAYGAIGINTTGDRWLPQQVLGGESGSAFLRDVAQVSASYFHTMALKTNGTVYAWGSAQYGQLGNGRLGGDRNYPWYGAPIQVLTGEQGKASGYLENVVQIDTMGGYNGNGSAYYYGTSLALTEQHTVYGWGSNWFSNLSQGDGFYTTAKLINHNYFVTTTYTDGDGNPQETRTVETKPLDNVVSIAGGGSSGTAQSYSIYGGSYTYSLFIDDNEDVHGVGYGNNGQLGSGPLKNINGDGTDNTPALQDTQNSEDLIHDILQISGSSNGYHSAAWKRDGTVWTWGYNYYGQLGNGTTLGDNVNINNQTQPVQVGGGGSNAMRITHGKITNVDTGIIRKNFNKDNEIITNITIAEDEEFQIDVSNITLKQSFSLLPDTQQPDPGNIHFISFNEDFATVDYNTGLVKPVVGTYGTAIILVKDIGKGYSSLIRVSTKPKDTEDVISVASPMIAAGGAHVVALRYDGTVWTWGRNGRGQLGNNTTESIPSPVQVIKEVDDEGKVTSYLKDIIQVAAGAYHSIALDKDGYVWTWGSNDNGQLGVGRVNDNSKNISQSTLPVQVAIAVDEDRNATSYLKDIVHIAAGFYHNLALTKEGTIYAWGHNPFGAIGDNTTGDKYLPSLTLGGESGSAVLGDIVQVSAGLYHSLALKSNGTVYAFGAAQYGQLGNGRTGGDRNYPCYTAPIQVLTGEQNKASGNLENIVQIDATGGYNRNGSGYHYGVSLALTEQHQVYGWGCNLYGELTNNDWIYSTPTLLQKYHLDEGNNRVAES